MQEYGKKRKRFVWSARKILVHPTFWHVPLIYSAAISRINFSALSFILLCHKHVFFSCLRGIYERARWEHAFLLFSKRPSTLWCLANLACIFISNLFRYYGERKRDDINCAWSHLINANKQHQISKLTLRLLNARSTFFKKSCAVVFCRRGGLCIGKTPQLCLFTQLKVSCNLPRWDPTCWWPHY